METEVVAQAAWSERRCFGGESSHVRLEQWSRAPRAVVTCASSSGHVRLEQWCPRAPRAVMSTCASSSGVTCASSSGVPDCVVAIGSCEVSAWAVCDCERCGRAETEEDRGGQRHSMSRGEPLTTRGPSHARAGGERQARRGTTQSTVRASLPPSCGLAVDVARSADSVQTAQCAVCACVARHHMCVWSDVCVCEVRAVGFSCLSS